MELKPKQMRNDKTSTSFLKRGKYLENERFLLHLSDIKVYFFQIESIPSKIFLKKTISVTTICLHHLQDVFGK